MKYGSVCSGIEAATAAWHPLGWNPAFFSEIEAAPRAVLAHHYPTVPLHGDFTTIEAGQYEPIDLLVGGTPCQDFSVAGLRAGLAGDRGNLTLEFVRLVDRLRPCWVVWENVPGVLSIDGGRAFGAFLGGLAQLGYGFAYRILDAQHFGVPQRRRRVFVVGYLGDWRRAAAVLFERESLSGNPPPRREAGQGFAADVAPSIGASGRGFERAGETRGQDPVVAVEPYTLAIRGRGDSHDLEYRQDGTANAILTPNGGRAGIGVGAVAAFGGNDTRGPIDVATAVNAHGGPHGRQDFESETFIAQTITADMYRSGGATAGNNPGVRNCFPVAFSSKDHGADAGDTAPTLRAMGHAGSHANAGGQVAVVTPIDMWQASRGAKMTNNRAEGSSGGAPGTGIGEPGDPSPTVASSHVPAIASSAVRRLTPMECERLQGFPDGYTLVPRKTVREKAHAGPCLKQIVTATIVAKSGTHYVGTNGLAKPQPTCPRAGMPTGQGYELCRDICQQSGHAEVNAIKVAGKKAVGATLYLQGHTYACEPCKAAAHEAGIKEIIIGPPPGDMADGPRYKMLGNSMAVPCMRWIGERIDMVTALAAKRDAA